MLPYQVCAAPRTGPACSQLSKTICELDAVNPVCRLTRHSERQSRHALQDELDWTQFAVVLHRSDVGKLSEIDRLDAAAMRSKLRE